VARLKAEEMPRVRVPIARDHLADIRALDARIKYLGVQIAAPRPDPPGLDASAILPPDLLDQAEIIS
jgi:hypothetical protein